MQQQTLAAAFTAIAADINTLARAFEQTPTDKGVAMVESSLKLYHDTAQKQVYATGRAIDDAVGTGYREARAAVQKRDADSFRVQRQLILKAFLQASYAAAKRALEAGDANAATPWIEYIAQMARWEAKNEGLVALNDLRAGKATAEAARPKVMGAVLAWFSAQIKDEVQASIKNMKEGKTSQAYVEAIEAMEYFRPIQMDLGNKIGFQKMRELQAALDHYRAAAAKKDVADAEDTAKKVAAILG